MPPIAVEPAGPRLETARLILRRPQPRDAAAIERLAGDWEVARYTAQIPHPYGPGVALAWIESLGAEGGEASDLTLVVVGRETDDLVGCVALTRPAGVACAVIGYWIGRPFWGRGYASEAAAAVLAHAFERLGVARLKASVAPENRASARILQKLGFRFVGRARQNAPARGGDMEVELYELERVGGAPAAPVVLVVAVALVDRDGRVLLARRPEGKAMAGLWEFPGGKVNGGESPEAALVRELMEELEVDTKESCLAPLAFASHRYPDFHLLMPLYVCRVWQGTPSAREGQELAWVRPARLADYPMPPADRPLVALLRDLL